MRPTYGQVLARLIEESGLTLRQLSERCEEAGVKATHSYISKIRSSVYPPPSTAVTVALAKAMGKDPAPLLALAMIERMEAEWQELYAHLTIASSSPTALG